jgi:hypothetical protein
MVSIDEERNVAEHAENAIRLLSPSTPRPNAQATVKALRNASLVATRQ